MEVGAIVGGTFLGENELEKTSDRYFVALICWFV